MNDQLKLILIKARLNFAVLAAIIVLAILRQFTNPEFTNTVFATTDQLVSNLYLVFITITLDAFIGFLILIQMGILVTSRLITCLPSYS
jgi:hypothetical protein